jgi:hypothetical protein
MKSAVEFLISFLSVLQGDPILDNILPSESHQGLSPHHDSLIWWRNKRDAIASLGRLPRNSSEFLAKRRSDVVDTIALRMKALADLENAWSEQEAERAHIAQMIKDPMYYGPEEQRPELPYKEPYIIDTGGCLHHSSLQFNSFPIDKFHNNALNSLHPIAAFLMILAAITSVLGKLPHSWGGVLLTGFRVLFVTLCRLYRFDTPMENYMMRVQKSIPRSIFQVQKKLHLYPPPSITYACCPNKMCSKIYSPSAVRSWPTNCTSTLPDGQPCCTTLLKADADSKAGQPCPIRPFVLYDIKSRIAEMVIMEPTASYLKKKPSTRRTNTVTDILQANLVRSFKGPVKGPNGTFGYFDAPDNETRLLFTLSVDWMNPFGVKAAGVSASVGVIAMCCVNLPLSIRYKPENLILVGVIPGPHEPVLDTINYFLKPIVDDLLILWEKGIRLSGSQISDSMPQIIRVALLALVTDMPASKKVSGSLSHTADAFCSLCDMKRADMANLDMDSWDQYHRTCQDHRTSGFAWANATGIARRTLAKATGIRFSELLRLPYWDPTTQVAVDVMHNLFLGIIKRHYTTILGMTTKKSPPGGSHLYSQPQEAKVKKGRRILNLRIGESQAKSLKASCTWADLYFLARECGATINSVRKENSKASLSDSLETWVYFSN